MSDEARAALATILLARVRRDKHPSATDMAMLEQMLPREWLPAYLEVLLEKVAGDRHPSISMLHRIRRLIDAAP